jgi:hypothetical protein
MHDLRGMIKDSIGKALSRTMRTPAFCHRAGIC